MRRPPLVGALALLASPSLAGAVPLSLSHTGYVVDGSDRAVERDSVPMQFSLWKDPESTLETNRVWDSGAACGLKVQRGHYATTLGGGTLGCGANLKSEDLPFGELRFLEISIDGVKLSPRMLINPAPSAAYAEAAKSATNADKLGNKDAADYLLRADTNLPLKPGGTASEGTWLRGDGTWAQLPPGEVATAANLGGGSSLFKAKTGSTFEFRTIKVGSANVTVTQDDANDVVKIDVAPGALALDSLAGTLGVEKGGTGVGSIAANALVVGNGTGAVTALPPGPANSVLVSNGTTWAPQVAGGTSAFVAPPPTCTGAGKWLQWSGTAWDCATAFVPGSVIAFASARDNVFRSLSGTIPYDDSLPQITEGNKVLELTVTPKAANSVLRFSAQVHYNEPTNNSDWFTVALFRTGTNDALSAATAQVTGQCTGVSYSTACVLHLNAVVDAGSTSAQTFQIRAGLNNGTFYLNGAAAFGSVADGRRLGGALNTTFDVMEIAQ